MSGFNNLPDRFKDKVEPDRFTGCWEWTAYKNSRGYGVFKEGGMTRLAHRVSLESCEELVDGLDCDHLCKNRACVNPDHLEQVSHSENMRRADAGRWRRELTHCKRGHRFTPENVRPVETGRACRACEKIRYQERRKIGKR